MSARSRERSRELAAHLKDRKVERVTGNCSICHHTVSVIGNNMRDHIGTCKGRRR